MALLMVLVTFAIFAGLIALVVRISGRRFPGDITGPRRDEVDYDNPYPAWNVWTNKHPAPRGEVPRVRDDFEIWESEHWPRREK
jgi:hypothetical protein